MSSMLPVNTLSSIVHSRNEDADDQQEQEILILSRNSQSQLSLTSTPAHQSQLLKLEMNLPQVSLKYPLGTDAPADPNAKVFFFDIDNCLYRRSLKIHDLMQIYIHRYFKKNLHLNDEEANHLHMHYYKQYGLAIEGLVRLHKVDALEYNKVVDDALPLEKILVPNPELRDMLLKIKKANKMNKVWLFTNAYRNHGLRVIKLLGLGDLFDGMTFCDYSSFPLTCKPMQESFDTALKNAGVTDPKNAYFVDDSEINVKSAQKLGWGKTIHYVELDEDLPTDLNTYKGLGIELIRDILDIEKVCPEIF